MLTKENSSQNSESRLRRLQLLIKEYSKDQRLIDPKNIAFMTDRILVGEKKKQLYGTQFYLNINNEFIPRPIKDPNDLEARRKQFGLPPMKEYLDSAKHYKPTEPQKII